MIALDLDSDFLNLTVMMDNLKFLEFEDRDLMVGDNESMTMG